MDNQDTNTSSCSIGSKNDTCCSSTTSNPQLDYKNHWDEAYTKSPNNKLGWFETNLKPTLQLIDKTGLPKNSRIINIGAGSTTLVDELIKQQYKNIIATDISEVALNIIQERIREEKIKIIVDDLTNPSKLNSIAPVDLWIDRAVLHFFTEQKDQDTYFNLLKEKVTLNGFVILAQFNLLGAKKCSGLDVHRYDTKMFQNKLGEAFSLIDTFDYKYTMPSGDKRDYVYALFKRKK